MKTYRPLIGDTIDHATSRAIRMARDCSDTVTFRANGIGIVVAHDSDAALIRRDYDRAMIRVFGRHVVGPYPRARLSALDVVADAFWRFVMVLRRWRFRMYRRPTYLLREARLRVALAFAPPLQVRDAAAWRAFVDENTDPMGARCVRYATEWGRLMQSRIARGGSVSSCSRATGLLALGRDNPSGYVVERARAALIFHWTHGNELTPNPTGDR